MTKKSGDYMGFLALASGVLILFLLYRPATSEILWVNNCDNLTDFTPILNRYSTFETFSETYGVAPYCLRLTSTGGQGEIQLSTPITPQIQANSSTGEYGYVLGARVKVKDIAAPPNWDYQGFSVKLFDASGDFLGGFRYTKAWGGYGVVFSLSNSGYGSYNNVVLDEWMNVEIFINPSGTKLILNGSLLSNDTQTHLNAPPSSLQLDLFGTGQSGHNEVFVDQLYVKQATEVVGRSRK